MHIPHPVYVHTYMVEWHEQTQTNTNYHAVKETISTLKTLNHQCLHLSCPLPSSVPLFPPFLYMFFPGMSTCAQITQKTVIQLKTQLSVIIAPCLPSAPKSPLPTPFTLPLISKLHPHKEVMKLEKGERKNGGGAVGRWKDLPTHLG